MSDSLNSFMGVRGCKGDYIGEYYTGLLRGILGHRTIARIGSVGFTCPALGRDSRTTSSEILFYSDASCVLRLELLGAVSGGLQSKELRCSWGDHE